MSKGHISTIMVTLLAIFSCLLWMRPRLSEARSEPPDAPSSQVLPISKYLVAHAVDSNEQEGKRIAGKLVRDHLLDQLGGRAAVLNKDYDDATDADCLTGVCEVIQITVDEAPYKVTYRIESQLLPTARDKRIWDENEPATCSISPDRLAKECLDPMLHRLALKILAHDAKVHRPLQ